MTDDDGRGRRTKDGDGGRRATGDAADDAHVDAFVDADQREVADKDEDGESGHGQRTWTTTAVINAEYEEEEIENNLGCQSDMKEFSKFDKITKIIYKKQKEEQNNLNSSFANLSSQI